MVGLGCIAGVGVHPRWQLHRILVSKCQVTRSCSLFSAASYAYANASAHESHRFRIRPCCVPPDNRDVGVGEEEEGKDEKEGASTFKPFELEWKLLTRRIGDSGIISSCFVGLLTGVAVVLFNYLVSLVNLPCQSNAI